MSADLKFEQAGLHAYTGGFGCFDFHAEIYEGHTADKRERSMHNKSEEFISQNKYCLGWYLQLNNEEVFTEVVDFSPNEFSKEEKHKTLKACLRNWLQAHAEVFLTASIEDEY